MKTLLTYFEFPECPSSCGFDDRAEKALPEIKSVSYDAISKFK